MIVIYRVDRDRADDDHGDDHDEINYNQFFLFFFVLFTYVKPFKIYLLFINLVYYLV